MYLLHNADGCLPVLSFVAFLGLGGGIGFAPGGIIVVPPSPVPC